MGQQDDLGRRWVDFRSAVALIGVNPTELAWAMVHDVTFSTRVPGHEGQPMLCVESLYRWAGLASEPLAPEPN
jgi:hypothetical protein